MSIFCEETVKTSAAASEYIFYVSANVRLILGVFQCFLKNVRLLLKDINEGMLLKENVQLTFLFCVVASTNISTFLMKVRLHLKRY